MGSEDEGPWQGSTEAVAATAVAVAGAAMKGCSSETKTNRGELDSEIEHTTGESSRVWIRVRFIDFCELN